MLTPDTAPAYNPLWARFKRYVVENHVLLPASNAALLPYDQWEAHSNDVGKTRVIASPYVDLLNLVADLDFPNRSFAPWEPSEKSIELIKAWASQHGLLGVLPATYREITFPPVLVKSERTDRRIVRQHRHVLVAGDWREMGSDSTVFGEVEADEFGLLTGRADSYAKPQAVVWRWESARFETQPLHKAVYRFFPRVEPERTASHSYPLPGTDEFFRQYGEPVDVFCRWATQFAEAAQLISSADFDVPTTDQPEPVHRAMVFMTSLSTTVAEHLETGNGSFRRVRVSPALLSTYAEMFLSDLARGWRIRNCKTCSKIFVAANETAFYCSTRCRNTMQRRRQRQKED